MTNPQRFVTRMIVFLLFVLIVGAALYDIIITAFLYNPALNSLILVVLLVGIAYNFRRVMRLKPEIRWIEAFRTHAPGFSLHAAPRLVGPVASALGEQERRGRGHLAAASMRYLLDSISARLDESRDITRYLTGLLIFLGLLGTFWGLLQTINSVGAVIGNMSIGEGDLTVMFDDLRDGLARPLAGMGTAFSSSLFGLAGSLVLGFLDLQATQAQNSFYNETEEWLSGLTRLSSASTAGMGEGDYSPLSAGAYVQAMVEQTGENLDKLVGLLARGEESRQGLNQVLGALAERLSALHDQMATSEQLFARMVASQESLTPALAQLQDGGGVDEQMRAHIRNLDVQVGRLLEQVEQNRAQLSAELRSEIRTVSRTIATVAGEPQMLEG